MTELKDSERQPCEVWTRIMGYHRPMESANIGKKGEFAERKYFTEERFNKHINEHILEKERDDNFK